MQAVLDVPVAPDGAGEQPGVERQGGEVVAALAAGDGAIAAAALDLGLHPRDGAQTRETRLAGEAPVGGEPVHVVADPVAAGLDAAVPAIDGLTFAVQRGAWVVEQALDLAVQAGLVVLYREQVIAAPVEDGLGDFGLAPSAGPSIRLRRMEPSTSSAHRVCRDQGAG